ncbi:MAG: hypothetical protein P1U57_09190 [Oleibacter sp.]|nr:hypothetical protein [Thalassolituus sp.]
MPDTSNVSSKLDNSSPTALLIGATGLIGGKLLERMLSEAYYQQVVVLARRECPSVYRKFVDDNRLQWLTNITDDGQLTPVANCPNIDHFFCALGTTQKQSGKSGLQKVDRDLVISSAQFAVSLGAKLLSVVSARDASSTSLFFYNRTKGQMEDGISQLPARIHFWQPSILLGDRNESRPMERLAGMLLQFQFLGNLSARSGATVATAMLAAAQQTEQREPQRASQTKTKSFNIERFRVDKIDYFSKLSY